MGVSFNDGTVFSKLVDPSDPSREAIFDSQFKAPLIIGVEDYSIHLGNHYFYTDNVTLNSGNSQDYLITVPDTSIRMHFVYGVTGTDKITIRLYEATDKSGSSSQTVFNNDRDSSNTSGLTIDKGTTGGSTDGTLIRNEAAGANKQSGLVDGGSATEILLKTNTKYILRLTSSANSNLISVAIRWYENTPQ